MKYEIYSEDTGRVFKEVEADSEGQVWIIAYNLIAELKSKNLLGPDRLFVREVSNDTQT